MDLLIIVYWLLAFTIIVSFLGGLTYFIQQQTSTEKFQIDTMNQQSGRRSSGSSRRKNARHANRKRQQQQQTSNGNPNTNHVEEEEKDIILSETTNDKEHDSTLEQSDVEQEENDPPEREKRPASSSLSRVEDVQESMIVMKQRNKNKSPNVPLLKEEVVVPAKPQASVAPVKQVSTPPLMRNSSNNFKSSQTQQDNYPKTNGHLSSPSYPVYTYSSYNPLPPRFQHQRQQKEAEFAAQKQRKRREPLPPNRSSIPPGSAARPNEFVPLSLKQQQQQQQEYINNDQMESYIEHPQQQQQQQESSVNNGYSSESDIRTDSPLTTGTNSISPLLSTSMGSQSSLQRLDLVRSLATSHGLLEEIISIFDTIPFSSDELDLVLSKIATKHISDKHDLQRLLSSTKSDKTLERILDETYRSQAKILAIELQSEKNRILELTKTNSDMENTIRQLQQQHQQQQSPNNMAQYQHMILPYQMQLQRLADENTRLQHQLHAYSMLPATINDLKQQQHILNEKIRQISIRNSALENEVADSERASKHAAEIYKKADAQKQERIEQMIADINKYKKLDKELTNLRQKHNELEKNLNTKITEVTHERNEFQTTCLELKDKVEQYDQLQIKYNQLVQNRSKKPINKLQDELNDVKSQNDQLRQRNWKIMEELNKLLHEQQQNQDIQPS